MKRKNDRGFVLAGVVALMLVVLILMPPLIRWIQQDTNMMVKDLKRTAAFNLAEAGLDRGQWKLSSTTTTWTTALAGTVIAGYNFDTSFTDVSGGVYRIKFSSGPAARQVTILAEGRDSAGRETRAVSEVVQNQTIYSALMSGGNVTWGRGLGLFWGPIMSQGNITMDSFTSTWYYPRKFAKGVVTGTAGYLRDSNGLNAPNTDNVEWWSQYSGVPALPILDFAALRSSAAATNTLNIYGCRSTQGGAGTLGSATRWDTRASCPSSGAHATHLGNAWSHPLSPRTDPNASYVWYWDGDLTLSGTGTGTQGTGLRGIFIVRGNLVIETPGSYNYTANVPSSAYLDHNKMLISTFDTATTNQYPADNGLRTNRLTFGFGTETWCQPSAGCGWRTTVGLRGFTYIGGNLTILNYLDFHGAVWVNGTVTAAYASNTAFCGVFFDDTLEVPALNVILIRQTWNEIAPNSATWL